MKKRMKQMVALGVAVILLLGGCSEPKEEPVVEEVPQTEESEAAAEEELVTEPVEEPEEESASISVNIDTNQKNYYFKETEDSYLYLQYCDVTVDGGENANLKKNIENWSMEQSEGLRSEAVSLEAEAVAAREDRGEYFDSYSLVQEVAAARIDGRVVSLMEDTYYYLGGAHGIFYKAGINFDAKNGKRLEFQEIFSDYENFKAHATERIIYQLQENYGENLFDDYIETVENMWQDAQEPQWYFEASGLVIVLEQYMVGPYSVGLPEIYLPYAEIKQYIKEAYLPDNQDGIALFRQNQEVYLALPDEEEDVAMILRSELKDDFMYNSLWLGNDEVQLQDYVAVQNAYVVKTGGEVYCMVEVDEASDDYKTYIFRLTEGKLEKIEEIYAGIDENNVNVREIRMEETIDLLGTYGGIKNYHFDENGQFVTYETEYLLQRNSFVLTTKVDIPVTLEGAESSLPAGSHIILFATDNETYVKFTIQETGQSGLMMVERNENDYYQITINGMNEQDCFELLPYAG